MASDYSQYLGNKLMRWLGGNAFPSPPSFVEIGLFDGDPKSGGTEVTTDVDAGGRQSLTFTVPSSGTTNTMTTSADVDFGTSANDVSVSHVAFYDDSGNLLASEALAGGPYSVTTGTPVKFLAGDIDLKLGSP